MMARRFSRGTVAAAAFCLAGSAFAGTVSVIVTDREGKPVADAVVLVESAAAGTARRPLPSQAQVLQSKMQFVPAVTLLPVGGKLTFINEDSWEHHVRGTTGGMAQAATGRGFELRLDGKPDGKPARTADVTVTQPGPVLLGCHIHGSMRGHVFVTATPWAMKTTAEGQAVIEDVPDGPVQVRVWQADQLLDLPAQAVTVSGAAPARVTFQLQVVPRRRRA